MVVDRFWQDNTLLEINQYKLTDTMVNSKNK